MNYKKETVIIFICGALAFGILIGAACFGYDSKQNKYSMNLKCVQGELYEEIKPHLYIKSHLECFEQTRL